MQGVRCDSKREAAFAQQLDLMMHARDPRERVEGSERQVSIPLVANGRVGCLYICDFVVRNADGRKELVDVKGVWTDYSRLKRKLFEATWLADHPELATGSSGDGLLP